MAFRIPLTLTFFKGRNFALNPGEGLKIHAFKDAQNQVLATEDRELEKLAHYMVFIANEDLRTIDHKVRLLPLEPLHVT